MQSIRFSAMKIIEML